MLFFICMKLMDFLFFAGQLKNQRMEREMDRGQL